MSLSSTTEALPKTAPNLVRRGADKALGIVGGVLIFCAFWQAMSWIVGSSALASPAASFAWAWRILTVPRYWPHLQETFLAFAYAWSIAMSAGLLAGLMLGASRLAGDVAEPVLMALYSIPKVTLYPVVLLLFGIGINAKIAFGAMHGILPVALLTMNAIRHVPVVHRRTARAMRLSRLQTTLFVLLPCSLPEIAAGIRLGTALTLLGVMVGELFASKRGLGFMLMTAIESADVPRILGVVVIVATFALVLNGVLMAVERRLRNQR